MSQLVLINYETKEEIGRRDMVPQERYEFYRGHIEHELLLFQGAFYVTHTVGWRIPQEDFMASVTFHSHGVLPCGCLVGRCTCD